MTRKIFAGFILALLMISAACAEPYLLVEHVSFAGISEGRADYSDTRFGYVRLRVRNDNASEAEQNIFSGTITLSGGNYSYYDGDSLKKVSGTSQTFTLIQNPDKKKDYLLLNKEQREIRFALDADNGLNGVNASWNFPDMPSMNGQDTIPNHTTTQQQKNTFVPYFEYVRDGSKVTGLKWRIVNPEDISTPLPQNFYMGFDVFDVVYGDYIYSDIEYWTNIEPDSTPEGIAYFNEPIEESEIWRVDLLLTSYESEEPARHLWKFWLPRDAKPYLWSAYMAQASLINGKSDYKKAKFRSINMFPGSDYVTGEAKFFTDQGRITIPGGGYSIIARNELKNPIILQDIALGQDKTFGMIPDEESTLGGGSFFYRPVDDNGTDCAFGGDAEKNLPGKTIIWTLTEELGMSGSAVVPNYKTVSEQLNSGVPYIELVSADGYFKTINYKIVTSQDTSTGITPAYRTDFEFYMIDISGNIIINNGWINNTASGTYDINTPVAVNNVSYINALIRSHEDNNNPLIYTWRFYPESEDIIPDPFPVPVPDPSKDIPPVNPDSPNITPESDDVYYYGGGGGGGCQIGLSFMGLIIAASFIFAKKR